MTDVAEPLSGSIDPRTFPLVLMSLHRNGVTGSLKVEGPVHQKALYFRSGRVLFGSSNDPRDELGAILIAAGKLSAEQLAEVKSRVGPGNPLAKALQDSGFVSQREIGEAARGKVEQILSDVLAYDAGNFEFEDGVLPKGAIDLKLSTPRLVLAATRRVSDRAFVLRHLESLDAVLGPGATEAAEVKAEAGALLGLLDGERTLKEAAAAAALDEFEAAKTACGLLFLGVVEKRGASEPALAAESEPLDLGLGADETPLFAAPEPPGRDVHSETMMLPSPFARVRPAELGEETAEPSLEATLDETFSRLNSADVQKSFVAMREQEAPAEPAEPGPGLDEAPAPEPEPPATAAPRASKAELAAIDSLLKDKPATEEGPLTPFERHSERNSWEPEFPAKPAPPATRKPRAGKQSGSRSLLPIALGGVALMAAGAAWYLLAGPGRTATEPPPTTEAASSPSPTAPAASTTPSPAAASRPTGLGAEPPAGLATGSTPGASRPTGSDAGVNPSPVPQGIRRERSSSAPAPPSGSPGTAATTPATTPVTAAAGAATPAAMPVRSPSRATSPAAAPPSTAAPGAAAKPAAARPTAASTGRSAGWADAAAALRRGDLAAAARAFAQAARSSGKTWTTQVLVACSADTVAKAAAAVASDDLFVVPVRYQKRDCYRVLWGLADSEAQAAASEVPGYFKAGGASPKAVPLRSVLP